MKRNLYWAGMLFVIGVPLLDAQPNERLSLTEAIDIAIQNNPRILRVQKEIEAADARILQAGRIPNPEFEISWNETPTNFNIGDADEQDIGIVQQVEFPGKRSNRVDIATHERSIAELALERIRTLVTAEVQSAYYGLLWSREKAKSLHEQMRLFRDLQELLTSRYQAEQAGYLDVLRVKIEITRLNNDLTEALRENRAQKSRFNIIIGRSADHVIDATDSLSYLPRSAENDTVVRHLLDSSRTLMIARRFISRQQSLLSLARRGYLPDFSVGLSHQRRGEEPPFDANRFTGTTTNSVGIQLGVSLPLWFWQEPQGQVQEAAALVEIASLDYASLERRVKANILSAIDRVRVMETQLRNFVETLSPDSRDILSTAINQYQTNQIDILNLVDVYRTYQATQLEYLRTLHDYAVALAELKAAGELHTENSFSTGGQE